MYNFLCLFIFFMIYSIIGYITEITFCYITSKKFTLSRGFLIGPYLPIYGMGAVIMFLFLKKYQHDPFELFIMTAIVCTVLEYFTSLIMEKIFKLRWWDYSKMPFNINGRVCLSNSALFGIGGLVLMYVVHPFVMSIVYNISNTWIYIIGITLLVIFVADLGVSTYTIIRFKKSVNKVKNEDSTKEVRQYVFKTLQTHSVLFNRLIKSFPNITKLNKIELLEISNMLKNIKINKKYLKGK